MQSLFSSSLHLSVVLLCAFARKLVTSKELFNHKNLLLTICVAYMLINTVGC